MADDYAASTSTNGQLSVGGSRNGSIETTGDTDWLRLSVTPDPHHCDVPNGGE